MPVRIQLKRTKGWRLPSGAVIVARPSRWGNLYRVELFGRELAIDLYKRSLEGFWMPEGIPEKLVDEAYAAHTAMLERFGTSGLDKAGAELRGFDLACWCKLNESCHADILLVVANEYSQTIDKGRNGTR